MKKSREKAKEKAEEISKNIEKLKHENETLEKRAEFLTKELALCKEIVRVHGTKEQKKS